MPNLEIEDKIKSQIIKCKVVDCEENSKKIKLFVITIKKQDEQENNSSPPLNQILADWPSYIYSKRPWCTLNLICKNSKVKEINTNDDNPRVDLALNRQDEVIFRYINMLGETVTNWRKLELNNKRLITNIKKILNEKNGIINAYKVNPPPPDKIISKIISTTTLNYEHVLKSNWFKRAVDYEVRSTTTKPEVAQIWFQKDEIILKFVCRFLLERNFISHIAAQKIISTYVKHQPKQPKSGSFWNSFIKCFSSSKTNKQQSPTNNNISKNNTSETESLLGNQF